MVKECFKHLAALNHSLYFWLSIVTYAPKLGIQKKKPKTSQICLTAACQFTVLVFLVLTCSGFLKKQQILHRPVLSEIFMDLYCCLCTTLWEFDFPSVLFFGVLVMWGTSKRLQELACKHRLFSIGWKPRPSMEHFLKWMNLKVIGG